MAEEFEETVARGFGAFAERIPGDAQGNLKFRKQLRMACLNDEPKRAKVIAACKSDPLFFFNGFCWLYEPRPKRVNGKELPMVFPFIAWEHQVPLMKAIHENLGMVDIGVEKSRGEGMSWTIVLFATWDWLFNDMRSIGLVSKDENSVDSPDDPDSLMWKADFLISKLPKWMVGEKDVDWKRDRGKHVLKNLRNGSTISGYAATANVASGGRKAQPLTASIFTPGGVKTMGEVSVGDRITGSGGKAVVVTGVYPQGEREVFEVLFSDGSKTECCGDHLWKVQSGWSVAGTLKDEVLPLSEVMGRYKASRYRIPMVSAIEFDAGTPLPIDPYVMGSLLGDGYLTKTGILFSSGDQESVDYINERLPDGLRLKHQQNYDYRLSSDRKGAWVNSVVTAVRNLGLAGKKANGKFIPDCYKYASVADRIELLRGLMDTDGCVVVRERKSRSCEVTFLTVSEQLSRDVQFLIQSLGGTAKEAVIDKGGIGTTGIPWQLQRKLTIAMPAGINPFRVKRKADKFMPRTRYQPQRLIVDIRPVGVKPVQCITVDASDRLYVTDGAIVTHNSWFGMDELSKFPRPQDTAAMASTQHVTNCRLVVSTPNGADGEYYKLMHNPSSMVREKLHWTFNPSRNRGLYNLVNGRAVAVDPVKNPLPLEYEVMAPEVLEMLDRLRKRGFSVDKSIRSPWYDRECDRPGATPQNIAQELDIDYGGSAFRIFGADCLGKADETVMPEVIRGDLDYTEEGLEPTFDEVDNGPFRLWMPLDSRRMPPLHAYVVGCDVCTGLGGSYTSNSTIVAIDSVTNEQVLEYTSNTVPPADFADLSIAVCKWLNDAYLVWEHNGPGAGFTKRVIERGYPNVYHRTSLSKRKRTKTKEMGWWTSADTKEVMFEALRMSIRSGALTVRSRELVAELGQYIRKEQRIFNALSINASDDSRGASHGDRVIGLGVALMGLKDRPDLAVEQQQRKDRLPPPNTMAAREAEYQRSLKIGLDGWDDRTLEDYVRGS
jgi:hypothetical protein